MSMAQLRRWVAFEQEYGPLLVQDRIDIGLSKVMYILAQAYRNPKARRPQLKDFLPPWLAQQMRPSQTPAQLEAVLKGMTSADH